MTLLALLLIALGGCNRQPPPLGPPDLAAQALDLTWGTCKGTAEDLRRAEEFRLTLTPGGRFQYLWRNTEESPESWKEIAGNWRSLGAGKWALEPDLGRASLQVGCFEDGEFPVLEWTRNLTAVGPAAPDFSGGMYMIPAVDPETGRILDAIVLQSDPRLFQRR